MSRRSGRSRARLRALAFISGTVSACIACAPGIAVAGAPQRSSFSFFDSGTETDTCGFPVDYSLHLYGTETDFVDHAGGQPSQLLHVHQDGTISANGVTLIERDNFNVIRFQDGSSRSDGTPEHIQGPGIVLLDAGQLVFGPDGQVVAVHGPHPAFFGATFCSALAP